MMIMMMNEAQSKCKFPQKRALVEKQNKKINIARDDQ